VEAVRAFIEEYFQTHSRDDHSAETIQALYEEKTGIVLSGSFPLASPWTNSRPLISFCSSALTLPYVLLRRRQGIGFIS
jgi:hypothetical protein